MRKLTTEEREFLGKVSEAAFANPFGEDRARLDRSIAGVADSTNPGVWLARAIVGIRKFMARLDRPKVAVLGDFCAQDRRLVRHALLFLLFHDYINSLDALIERQIRTGEGSCPVPFASDVLGEMQRHGIAEDEALKVFALFFQLRRAYYFIKTALVGSSSSMRRLRYALWNNVFTSDQRMYAELLWDRMEDFSSLILGETGTGKGAAAAAIGRSGYIPFDARNNCFVASFTSTFVAINLSQYPESLIESELFGHRKGAFTGAVESHEGVLSRCSEYGAVFLDEIGDVSIPVQIKLLRVLQERTFMAVGSHQKKSFRGRVIAATNKPLDKLRSSGKFRDDFYYRLCSDVIMVPPLRQRVREEPRELAELTEVVLRRIIGRDDQSILEYVLAAIDQSVGADYAWPGNVRELEQAVRSILLRGEYHGETPEVTGEAERLRVRIESGDYDAAGLLADYCRHLYARHGTYEAVARITGLDRRTVKKHITSVAQ